MNKDLLSINDLSREDILTLIDRAIEIKSQDRNANRSLEGYTLGLIFEKASTRTRVSFEIAMFRLGGQTIFLKICLMKYFFHLGCHLVHTVINAVPPGRSTRLISFNAFKRLFFPAILCNEATNKIAGILSVFNGRHLASK